MIHTGANRRWLILGASRAGKSVSARWIVEQYRPRRKKILILSTVSDWGPWVKERGGRWLQFTFESIGTPVWALVAASYRETDLVFCEFVGWDEGAISTALDELSKWVWAHNLDDGLIVVDEAGSFVPLSNPSRAYCRLVKALGHRGIDIIHITQSPQDIAMTIRDQANVLVIHRLSHDRAIEHTKAIYPALDNDRVKALQTGEKIVVDVTTGSTAHYAPSNAVQRANPVA